MALGSGSAGHFFCGGFVGAGGNGVVVGGGDGGPGGFLSENTYIILLVYSYGPNVFFCTKTFLC